MDSLMAEYVAVRNAADPEQVEAAGHRDTRREERRHVLIAAQLATPEGRQFLWDIVLADWRDFVTSPGSVQQLAYDAGRRARAAGIGREVFEQHGRAYLQMEREAIERHEREQAELAATHTRKATRTKSAVDVSEESTHA
jgi:hypothetical protein